MASQHHTVDTTTRTRAHPELRFLPLTASVQSVAFPCDAAGRVDIDALGEQERNAYLFARALMGRHYAFPVIGAFDGARPCAVGL